MQGLKKKKEIKRRSEVQKKLAEVHGNRTHQGRRSAPHTGFEVQESHQCPIHFHSIKGFSHREHTDH